MKSNHHNKKNTEAVAPTAPVRPAWIAVTLGALAMLFTWSYWPIFAAMYEKWSTDPQYSHAYLVPAFSLFLVWSSRHQLRQGQPSWYGAVLLLIGVALRLVGARYFVDWLEAISILPILAGAVLLIAGWPSIRRVWPAIAFLFFMIPLPHFVELALSHPLQRIATKAATLALQTFGRPAFAEGNVIAINDARIGVVDACNGLGMFLLFFALATAVAMLVQRPLWEKLLIVASAAPIAVAVNVVRVTLNALFHEAIGSPKVDAFFHDFAGWLMMPMALGVLWLELKFLSHLLIEDQHGHKPRGESKVSAVGPRRNRSEAVFSGNP